MTVELQLSRGLVTIVDDEDADLAQRHRWYAMVDGRGENRRFYAATQICLGYYNYKKIRLHRLLMGFPKLTVDHINRNTLDNRRSNLRLATKQQNCWNGSSRGSTSQFKGVSWYAAGQSWTAQITKNYRRIYLGRTKSQRLAALVYDAAARLLFDEFAGLNFPNTIDAKAAAIARTRLGL